MEGRPLDKTKRSHKAMKEIVTVTYKGVREFRLPQDYNPMTGWREPDGSITVLCYRIRRVSG